MKRKRLLLILTFFITAIILQANPVVANSPSAIELSYDFSTQVLTVDITHPVSNVNTHYLYEVVVEKNEVNVLTRGYTSQNTTSGFSATYSISAVHGDVLEVTASCILGGSINDQITVVDPSVTPTTTSDPSTTTPTGNGETPLDMTLIIAAAVIALGVIAVVFAFMRRR